MLIHMFCRIFLQVLIYLSHMIWLLRTRQLRKQAKLEGKNFDDLPEARKYQHRSKKRGQQRSSPLDLETGNAAVVVEPNETQESIPTAIAAHPAQKESGIVSCSNVTTASDMDSIELPEKAVTSGTNTLRDQGISSLSENEKIE